MKKKIAILGSTGSIGKSLIDILKNDKKGFEIVLLSTNKNLTELNKQIKIFKVKNIIISNKSTFLKAKKIFKNKKINVYDNFDNLKLIFKKKKIDYVMSSISGLAGLTPTINIIQFCKTLAIANKESIICAWDLIKKRLNKFKTKFIPVDSEHFSIWSLLNNNDLLSIKRIHITASGGPFINYNLDQFKKIKVKDALKHPNWSMGKKITIDSATMMNKVFEVIETNRIFDINYKKISVLSHEKSYLHAIVELNNGLIKFLVHEADMKIPIFNSLYNINGKKFISKNLNINYMNNLNLNKIDSKKFPVIKILKNYPLTNTLFDTIIITINDNLVDLFLKKKISFIDISKNLLNLSKSKEFQKFKKIKPKNVDDIYNLKNYVSLKMTTLGI
jgi:1-deoxy-D-xylulose-5-phosphate reductoisomerase